jgi:hypothetical protein
MSEFVHEEAKRPAGRQASTARVSRPNPVAARERHTETSQTARTHSAGNASTPQTAASRTPTATADRDSGDDRLFGEILGGLLGGGAGAAVGGLIGGGIGAVIGGVLGAVAGGIIGHLASRRTVTINVTKLAGVADTVGVDVARANTVYRQADVHVSTGTVTTLPAAVSNAILGADGALDNFTGNTLTAEETMLVGHNRTPGRITAYYVPKFRDPGLRGEAIRPSRFGVPDPSVVVGASTRKLDTLAHELGHALTNDGSHPSDASNLMASGAIRNFTDTLTPAQISAIQSSAYAR